MIAIRDMNLVADRAGVTAIDTSFTTPTVFDVAVTPQRVDLVERTRTRRRPRAAGPCRANRART